MVRGSFGTALIPAFFSMKQLQILEVLDASILHHRKHFVNIPRSPQPATQLCPSPSSSLYPKILTGL